MSRHVVSPCICMFQRGDNLFLTDRNSPPAGFVCAVTSFLRLLTLPAGFPLARAACGLYLPLHTLYLPSRAQSTYSPSGTLSRSPDR